jgi:hypothetical protein
MRCTVGNASVVSVKDGMTSEARSFAATLPADPEYDLVVVDLPADCPVGIWESLAATLPRRRRGVRLVIGGLSRQATALAGQWLSERLGRTVVAPDGAVLRGAEGVLFVHSGVNTGWVRFRPGHAPEWEAKRFPSPSWDSPAVSEPSSISSATEAEPLPGGMWIRPAGHQESVAQSRSRLVGGLPCQPEILTVVVGCPGTDPVALADVAAFYATLPKAVRPKVRFVEYGPVQLLAGARFGPALANQFGEEVVCYSGMPVGSAGHPEVFTVLPDGLLGWNTPVQQIAYQPQVKPGPAASWELRAYRAPIAGLPEIAPGVYEYAPDAVLEIVQSGLWIRAPHEAVNAATIRATPVTPAEQLIVFAAAGVEQAGRMRMLADEVLYRLDRPTRLMTRLVPSSTLFTERITVTGRALLAEAELSALDELEPTSDIPHPAPLAEAVYASASAGAFAGKAAAGQALRVLPAAAPGLPTPIAHRLDSEPVQEAPRFFAEDVTVVHSPLNPFPVVLADAEIAADRPGEHG